MESEFCTIMVSEKKDFKNYDKFFSASYCNLKRVLKDHIFECKKDEDGDLVSNTKVGDFEEAEQYKYKTVYKKGFDGRDQFPQTPKGLKDAIKNRKKELKKYKIETLNQSGIPPLQSSR